tara:strand:- start:464 stop:604 length:141 start_codon:yes stop_codon:yes gene_type:complete
LLAEDASLLHAMNILSEAGELDGSSESKGKANNREDIEASLENVSF